MLSYTDLAPKNESSPNVSAHGFWTRERGVGCRRAASGKPGPPKPAEERKPGASEAPSD